MNQKGRLKTTYNCSKTKNSNGRVCFNLASIPDSPKARRNTASKKACLLKISIGIDFGTRNFSNDGVLAHGAATIVVDDESIPVFESRQMIKRLDCIICILSSIYRGANHILHAACSLYSSYIRTP